MTRSWTQAQRLAAIFWLGVVALPAQTPVDLSSHSTGIPVAPGDPGIAVALSAISSDQIRMDIQTLVNFGTRLTIGSMDKELPANQGVTAAADWIFEEFTRISTQCGNCLEVKRDDFIEPASDARNSRIKQPTRIQNIYAVLRGTDPAQANRRVLVTGHYDSRATDTLDTKVAAPGANDDASGVAVSLECARVLSKLKFPATIVFAAVAGEEQGLNGSRHLARLAKSEGWELEAVLNDDIVGGDLSAGQDRSTVRVFSEGVPGPASLDELHQIQTLGAESDSPSREVARAITEVSRSYFRPFGQQAPRARPGEMRSQLMRLMPAFHPVPIFRRDRFLRGGDHTSFNAEGFAAVRLTEWRENFDHQHQTPRTEDGREYGDFIRFVDMDYVADVARLNAAALATFAAAPGEPATVHIGTAGLDNDTELSWAAPAGAPSGMGYEVVWRATDQGAWTDIISVQGTHVKLPLSKDNVVFGVRSVDAAGHRSPAVLPVPAVVVRPVSVPKG